MSTNVYKPGQLWLSPVGIVIEIVKLENDDWGVRGNIIKHLERSSWCNEDLNQPWAWNDEGEFDLTGKIKDTDLYRLLTPEHDPEYFI